MAHIRTLSIRGYRAISEEVVLDGLEPVVVLYGDNAVGKSAVLGALELLGRGLSLPPLDLLSGSGRWASDAAERAFGLVAADLNTRSDRLEVSATWSDGARARVGLKLVGQEWELGPVEVAEAGAEELVAPLRATIEKLGSMLNPYELDPHPSFSALDSAFQKAMDSRDALLDRISAFSATYLRLRTAPLPTLPVPAALRQRLAALWHAKDLSRRRRVRTALARFGELFPALGPGALEPSDSQGAVADWAWFGEHYAPELDRLGGGVQSAFGTLASILLTDATAVLLEEPESFVGERALPGLREGIRACLAPDGLQQVFVATHSVTLGAGEGSALVLLERKEGVTTARRAGPDQLARLAPSASPTPVDALGRLGLDGGVRLTDRMIERLGLKTGEFVYFVERSDGAFEIVSSARMTEALADD